MRVCSHGRGIRLAVLVVALGALAASADRSPNGGISRGALMCSMAALIVTAGPEHDGARTLADRALADRKLGQTPRGPVEDQRFCERNFMTSSSRNRRSPRLQTR
jgi:hypothetical protein